MKKLAVAVVLAGLTLSRLNCSAQQPSMVLPVGHFAAITDASYSPDCRKISTTSQDRTIKIWNPVNGRLLLTLSGFSVFDIVSRVEFSPDGRTLLTTNEAGQVKVWDANNGKLLFQPGKDPGVSPGQIRKGPSICRFSPDGKFIYMTGDSAIYVYEIRSAKLFRTFRLPGVLISTFDFNFDRKTLLATAEDGSASIWDIRSGEIARIINKEVPGTDLSNACFSPDGKSIVAFSDGILSLIDPSSGRLTASINNIIGNGFVFSPDGSEVLATSRLIFNKGKWKKLSDVKTSFDVDAGFEGFVTSVFDRYNGSLLKTYIDSGIVDREAGFVGSHEHIANFVCFSPDGKSVVQGWDKLRIWDHGSSKLLAVRDLPGDFLDLRYTPDSRRIFIVNENSVELLEAGSLKQISTFEPPVVRIYENRLETDISGFSLRKVSSAGLSPDGKAFYIVPKNSNSVKIIDPLTGKITADLVGNSLPVSSVELSGDGNLLLSKTSEGMISSRIWDINRGKLLNSFAGVEWSSASFIDSGKAVITISAGGSHSRLYRWNAVTGEKTDSVCLHADSLVKCFCSHDGKSVVAIDKEYEAVLMNALTGEVVSKLKGPVAFAVFSPDGSIVATTSWFSYINIWDAATGRLLHTLYDGAGDYTTEKASFRFESIDSTGNTFTDSVFVTPGMRVFQMSERAKKYIITSITSARFINTGKILISEKGEGTSRVWDPVSGRLIYRSDSRLDVNPEGTLAVLNRVSGPGDEQEMQGVADLKSGKILYKFSGPFSQVFFLNQEFSPDGKSILTAYQDSAKILNSSNGMLIHTIHFSGRVICTDWRRNRIIVHDNSRLIFFDLDSGRELLALIAIDLSDYLVVTPDNYYMGSKGAAGRLSWKVGNDLYRFDQFDLRYNRPDIVLQRMGNKDSNLINLYNDAYEKRLKKLGFTESMFLPEWHTPVVELINTDSLEKDKANSKVILRVKAYDSKYKIDRIIINVNGVPEKGSAGYSCTGEKRNSVVQDFAVSLSEGENTISVSCLNDRGVESFRQQADIFNNTSSYAKPDLYFIGMSVSVYEDSRFNLGYALKDGRDMSALFTMLGSGPGNFGHVYTDTLFNRQATKTNLLRLKKKLSGTKCDDQVVVFISGHGLLDRNFDFYYATWDMNFMSPEKKGVSFNELEGLLDGIPARKKLLMMDACHSGELDKEAEYRDEHAYSGNKEDIVFRGLVKEYKSGGGDSKSASSGLSANNSFELMQELFSELDKGSGATIISAAAGRGFAFESPSWNNGVFTYAVRNGLLNMAADLNHDGKISVSELRDYAVKKVLELTAGRQKPTTRKETVNYDWNIR
ncbi:MAG TPA: caspase family protein [Bacteroidales bacterium]|nr:caspase family protein [Bacteroidales bacterium]